MTLPNAGRFGAEAIISVLGVPVTSTPVTVYAHGTLTPTTLYTDQTMGSTTTNPINTDGLGNLTFYAVPGIYDLAFTVGGVPTTQVITVDPWPADIEVLSQTKFPMFGIGGTVIGTAQATGVPNAYMQTGIMNATPGASGLIQVTFPNTFPNALLYTSCEAYGTTGFVTARVNNTFAPQLGQVDFECRDSSGALITTYAVLGFWIAIGQ